MKREAVSSLHMPQCRTWLRTRTSFHSVRLSHSFQYHVQSPINIIETTQNFRIPAALQNRLHLMCLRYDPLARDTQEHDVFLSANIFPGHWIKYRRRQVDMGALCLLRWLVSRSERNFLQWQCSKNSLLWAFQMKRHLGACVSVTLCD